MNIFDKIKALLALNAFVNEEIKESKKMDGTKPGWKSSEFWLTMLTNLGTAVATLNGLIPAPIAAKILVVINGIYAVARTALKAVSDFKSGPPATPAA